MSASQLPVLCLLLPIATAVVCRVVPGGRPVRSGFGIAGMAALVGLASALLAEVLADGTVSLQMGGWAAPFGITLVADVFGATLVLVASIVGLMVSVHALGDIPDALSAGGFDGFVHLLIAGVCGAFLTGDVFNLYVWFEVMLIASFALMVIGGDARRLDGAVKYVVLNLVSTVVLLSSIGLLYGLAGSLNMADLHQRLPLVEGGLVTVVSVLFLVAFGIKAAVFPLYFWLPASYPVLPITVSALFAALMTKVGVYALMRMFTLLFAAETEALREVILVVAWATMITGIAGALSHTDIRRILAYHVIASIGFMLLGLGLGTVAAMAAASFYMIHGILIKALLFMLAGRIGAAGGSFELGRLGGLWRAHPGFSVLFLLAALALVGIPPLTGFWAKLALVEASLGAGAPWTLAILLLVSLLTFVPLIRIWSEAFWKSAPEGDAAVPAAGSAPAAGARAFEGATMVPVIALSLLVLAIGLVPGPLLALSERVATDLLSPASYVESVLGPAEEAPR